MANSQSQIDLITHCLEFMSNKEVVASLFTAKGLNFNNRFTYQKLAVIFENNPNSITVEDIASSFRDYWQPCNIKRHYEHLTSGLLSGHDWHGAMPSMLHRCIQNRVRECSDSTISLSEYLSIGSDIFKHEYFMVATHDICESSIILSCKDVIPPIRSKSVTDFVYDGIPYDLKVSTHTPKWKDKAGAMAIDEKKQLAYELYEGADIERMRKDAERCKHNWGLNRMYYLVSNQERWLSQPDAVVDYLLKQLNVSDNYFDITVHEMNIHICFIEQ